MLVLVNQNDYNRCFNYKNHLWISLTQRCNWSCWYCDHPNINNPVTVNKERLCWFINVINKYKNLLHNTEVLVEGGELGLVSLELLDEIFNSGISDKYSITTNGLFMKKGYHDRYKEKINYILYHIAPDIDNNTRITKYENGLLYQYTLVIHKMNVMYLDKLLLNNKDCMFLPHFLQPRRDDLLFLNKQDFINILDIINNYNNVFDFIKLRIRAIIKYYDYTNITRRLQDKCRSVMNKTMINLPLNKIIRCCVSMGCSSMELNEENLVNILHGKNIFSDTDNNKCYNCISSNVWRDIIGLDNNSIIKQLLV